MALKVELKPGERIIIGSCVVRNDNQRTRLFIEGDAPILREKDILTPTTADTPARRIYLAVQLMYLSNAPERLHTSYLSLVQEIIVAAPSTLPYVARISNQILSSNFYKALREAKALIEYERGLLKNAQSGNADIPEDDAGNGRAA